MVHCYIIIFELLFVDRDIIFEVRSYSARGHLIISFLKASAGHNFY